MLDALPVDCGGRKIVCVVVRVVDAALVRAAARATRPNVAVSVRILGLYETRS